jgi:hypothetical protein
MLTLDSDPMFGVFHPYEDTSNTPLPLTVGGLPVNCSPYQYRYNDCKSTRQAISHPYDDGTSFSPPTITQTSDYFSSYATPRIDGTHHLPDPMKSSGGSINSGRSLSNEPSHRQPLKNSSILQPDAKIVKPIVASDAMRKASSRRIKREPKYFCTVIDCHARLTTKANLTSSLFFYSPVDFRR